MTRATQIAWWVDQVEATRRAVVDARDRRRRRRPSPLFDEDVLKRGRRPAAGPSPSSAHVLIRGATITGGLDEERRRTLPDSAGGGGGPGGSSGAAPARGSAIAGGGGRTTPLSRARQLAAGYQPAVVKLVSFARGAARATATGQYVQRDEVALETHDGRLLPDREAVADEIKAWSSGFGKRAESQDVVAVRLRLHGVPATEEGRSTYERAIASGFAGHRFASRVDELPNGELEARVVAAMAGAARERFRVREQRVGTDGKSFSERRLDPASDVAVRSRITDATGYPGHAISVVPGASYHGRDGVGHCLSRLIESGPAIDDRGTAVVTAADVRLAAREWGPSLRSQSSRDTMHLIISARAGTDVAALTNAARSFLHDRFADHRFMFGVHTDKEADGHIHAHAVITVRNEAGQKIHPNRDTFRAWREAYAEHAQAQGLKIVATGARERASSQSYGPRDKAIVHTAERPRPAREARDRAYAADPANTRLIDSARQRIRAARSNPVRLPTSEVGRREIGESVAAWRAVAAERPGDVAVQAMLGRLTMAHAVGSILGAIGRRVGEVLDRSDAMAITSAQMVKDLRLMDEAVSRTSDLLDGPTKQQFQEASDWYLETLANRIDLQRAQERGVEQVSRAEVESLIGINADRLIAQAREVEMRETREALSAQRSAELVVEAERRREGMGSSLSEAENKLAPERPVAARTVRAAAQEFSEAADATEAARVLADQPAKPLPPGLRQTDSLAQLKAEQARVLREIEAELADAQSVQSQRLNPIEGCGLQ